MLRFARPSAHLRSARRHVADMMRPPQAHAAAAAVAMAAARPQARAFSSSFRSPPASSSRSHPTLPLDTSATAEPTDSNATPFNATIEWLWQMAGGVPKGWEKFFPERGTGAPRSSNTPPGGGGAGGEGGGGNRRRSTPPPPPSGIPALNPWLIGLGGLVALYYLSKSSSGDKELTFQDFKTRFLERGLVERLEVDPITKQVNVFLKTGWASAPNGTNGSSNGAGEQATPDDRVSALNASIPSPTSSEPSYFFFIGSVESFERAVQETQQSLGTDPHAWVPIRYKSSEQLMNWGALALNLAMLAGVVFMIRQGMSGGGIGGKAGGKNPFSFGKSTAQLIKPGDSKVTFADVAGLDEAKVEVMEFVKFLQNPERFTKLGAKIPKGALLQGPPGTGKTLLAKAVAGEANVPFFSISGSDFLEMFVGVGPSRVRDLFAQARANTPCIIFIDEIDAVGRARSKSGYGGGNDERENTLNQLLVEMDGMGTTEGVVVLAGTNRKDMLDKALLRPGRFDRHITIDKPDIKGRAQIFMVHLKPLKTDAKHTLEDLSQRLAALTPGFAGADIHNLCNEAALIAARAEKDSVELVDFELASDRVLGGLEKKTSPMNAEEKALVAHHEAGHAVAAWFLEHADPLLKVTIVPRTSGALGFAQYLPKELTLYHQAQLLDMMAMALGGRAAEQIFFGRVSTGASDDLQKVTRIAQAQVTTYGMSERLGQVSYAPTQEENQFVKPFSEATAQAIDEEVRSIISVTYTRTLALLEKHRGLVAALANKLIEVENINHDVLLEILGPRPFQSDAYALWRKQSQEGVDEKKAAELKKKEQEALPAPNVTPEGLATA